MCRKISLSPAPGKSIWLHARGLAGRAILSLIAVTIVLLAPLNLLAQQQ